MNNQQESTKETAMKPATVSSIAKTCGENAEEHGSKKLVLFGDTIKQCPECSAKNIKMLTNDEFGLHFIGFHERPQDACLPSLPCTLGGEAIKVV